MSDWIVQYHRHWNKSLIPSILTGPVTAGICPNLMCNFASYITIFTNTLEPLIYFHIKLNFNNTLVFVKVQASFRIRIWHDFKVINISYYTHHIRFCNFLFEHLFTVTNINNGRLKCSANLRNTQKLIHGFTEDVTLQHAWNLYTLYQSNIA